MTKNDYYAGVLAFRAWVATLDYTPGYDWADLNANERREWADREALDKEHDESA